MFTVKVHSWSAQSVLYVSKATSRSWEHFCFSQELLQFVLQNPSRFQSNFLVLSHLVYLYEVVDLDIYLSSWDFCWLWAPFSSSTILILILFRAEFLFSLFQPIEYILYTMIKDVTLGYQLFAFKLRSRGLNLGWGKGTRLAVCLSLRLKHSVTIKNFAEQAVNMTVRVLYKFY